MTAYPVRPDPVPATTAGLTTAEITVIVAGLDPAALQQAGAAHTQLGQELAAVAAHLAQEAATLADHWSGAAAQSALNQFHRLHAQTATLAAQASQTGAVLTRLSAQVQPASQPPPATPATPATPAQARVDLTHLTAVLTRADQSLPAHIGTPGPLLATTSHPGPLSLTHTIRPTHNTSPADPTGPSERAGSATSPSLTGAHQPPVPAGAHQPAILPGSTAPPHPATGSTVRSSTSAAAHTAATAQAPGVTTAPSLTAAPAPPAPPASAPTSALSAPARAGVALAAPAVSIARFASIRRASARNPSDNEKTQPPATAAHTAAATILTPAPAPEPPTTTPAAPLSPAYLPQLPSVGVATAQDHPRQFWTTEDRDPWAPPTTCVPQLIEGG
jgi:uncharacterized protein YukE